MDLPQDIIFLIINKLGVIDTVSLFTSCKNLYELGDKDDKIKMSKLMNRLYDQKGMTKETFDNTINYACVKGYTDIIKMLSSIFLNDDRLLNEYIELAFNNNNE